MRRVSPGPEEVNAKVLRLVHEPVNRAREHPPSDDRGHP
ncbi:hypothetical protein GJR88_03382 [Dietzia sp. DQ12-45-1b]|nr:hypothetical protein GJR88_03382 [Dietzia sp. DQ12-45-1b]